MEVITISGYTEVEKFNIVRKYLISKQMEAHGLKDDDIEITDDAVHGMIRHYTREAGVRNLERMVATVCRKVAKKIVERRIAQLVTVEKAPSGELATTVRSRSKSAAAKAAAASVAAPPPNGSVNAGGSASEASPTQIIVTENELEEMLGPPKYTVSKVEENNEIGLTNGLAYTDAGGDMLQIEVSVVPGKGQVKITGKLGEVMQESAATAMSYVRSRAALLGLEKDFYQNIDIHLHVPEGAVPKDGPSAGITMATSITSALLKIPVKRDVAMTGEITLRGRVLPIGGLKEKLLAAKIGNIKTVLIPKENLPDLKKVPKEITKGMKVLSVEHVDQVLRLALQLDNPDEFLKLKGVSDLVISPISSVELVREDPVVENPLAVKH
jgi:ATP-dependent Lon protease